MPATEPLGASASLREPRPRRDHDEATANNSSTPSLTSRASSAGDDSADAADMRASMDTAIDKVKERARRSTDERRGSDDSVSNNRLSALIGRGKKLKRKEKSPDKNTLGVHSGDSGDLAVSDARSDGSLLDEDGNSSLLTDDGSDNEGYVKISQVANFPATARWLSFFTQYDVSNVGSMPYATRVPTERELLRTLPPPSPSSPLCQCSPQETGLERVVCLQATCTSLRLRYKPINTFRPM